MKEFLDHFCSIIIRTKNEERWITPCLQSVFQQKDVNFEVIIVDNESTDTTIKKVQQFNVKKILYCKDYLPGKALNMGISCSQGKFIVCLSGHCIPISDKWLYNLLINFSDPNVGGVYGRQEPLSFTPDSDKRDLMIIFGLDKKIQEKDSFFHNANSMIRKDLWEKVPFDDQVTNIEDRLWAKEILNKGYKIVYEPEASVYHYHGIHQGGDPKRCINVVNILKKFDKKHLQAQIDINNLNIAAIIPFKKPIYKIGENPIIVNTIEKVLSSKYIKSAVVTSETAEVSNIIKKHERIDTIIRPPHYSNDFISLQTVLKYTLNEMIDKNIIPDIIVVLSPTYPFLSDSLIDKMINSHIKGGFDSTIPIKIENRSLWEENADGSIKRIERRYEYAPRSFQEKRFVSFEGLCCVTHPEYILNEQLVGKNVGFYEIKNFYHCIEVRNNDDALFLEHVLTNSIF